MADQCVASVSNFAVGIVVARISGPAGLGAFALAYTCWILLTTIHRSLITDPMAILGDMRGEERDEFIRRGFAAEVTLGVAAAFIFAAVGTIFLVVGQHTFGIGMLAVAPWLVALDLQDYWRWIGFMQGTPRKSLMNDLLFNAVQALAFGAVFLAGEHSVFAVVSAWGLGAAIAALYGLRQFSVRPSLRGGVAFLRFRWPTSRWLASERAANWGGSQLSLLVAGALLGPAALGGLKAAQALVAGPAMVVINAGGSVGLPEASRQLAERGWTGMARVSRFVTGAGVLAATACGIAVLVAAPTLLKLLYGPQFVTYAPSARVFAVSLVIGAFGIGPVLTLTTTRRIRPLFMVQLGRLVFSVAAVCVLSTVYGVTGAAAATLLTTVLTLAAVLVLQSSARRSVDETRRRPVVRHLEILRRRLVRNASHIIGVSPVPGGDPGEGT
jgi:O-antigen/teichoic acid export membrane protein